MELRYKPSARMNKQSPYFFRPSMLIRNTAPRLIGSPWRNISWAGRDESERTHALCQTLSSSLHRNSHHQLS